MQPTELLRVLGKGMLTIPKEWREELGFQTGEMVQAEKTPLGVLIRPFKKKVPYRIYSRDELLQFVKEDQL
jgi:AbrB family looped-hinge helix DNA binding protein